MPKYVSSPTTGYVRVLRDIEDRIVAGKLAEGEVLPSTREMAAQYDVSMATVYRAMGMLTELGFIAGHQGRDRWVRKGARDLARAHRRARNGG